MTVFAPDRKNSSYQEVGGQYLRWYSMGKLVLGTGYWVSRCFAESGIFAPLRLLKGIGYWL